MAPNTSSFVTFIGLSSVSCRPIEIEIKPVKRCLIPNWRLTPLDRG